VGNGSPKLRGLAGNWRRPRRLPFIWRTSSTVFAPQFAPQCANRSRSSLANFAAYHRSIPGAGRWSQEFPGATDHRRRNYCFREGPRTHLLRSAEEAARAKERRRRFCSPVRRQTCQSRFVIFDLLWLNGRSLLKAPLHERRRHLSDVRLPSHFQIARVMPAHSACRDRTKRFNRRGSA